MESAIAISAIRGTICATLAYLTHVFLSDRWDSSRHFFRSHLGQRHCNGHLRDSRWRDDLEEYGTSTRGFRHYRLCGYAARMGDRWNGPLQYQRRRATVGKAFSQCDIQAGHLARLCFQHPRLGDWWARQELLPLAQDY